MAKPTRKGKAPVKKSQAEEAVVNNTVVEVSGTMPLATAKLTVSVKRRLSNGDEVFIAPGVEMQCSADELDTKQAEVTERVHTWMETLLEQYPDVSLDDEEDEEDAEEDEADEDEDEAEEDEDGLTEEDVAKMKLADLKALIKDEELDVDPKGMKLADLRDAVIAELFGDEDADEDEDEDAEEDEDEDADEDEDEDEDADEDEEGEVYTKAELAALKLSELQEVCDDWEIGHPTIKKGADAATKKKAYIKHILEAQEEE